VRARCIDHRVGERSEAGTFLDWPRFVWEILYKHVILAGVIAGLFVSKISIACDPHARAYMDRALAPVGDDNDATLDLLTKTAGASAAIAHIRKVAELTRASRLN